MKKVAVFLLAVLVIASVAQAGAFAQAQTINVIDSGWTVLYVMDLTSFTTQSITAWMFGNYNTGYNISYMNHWYGMYLYDQSYGGFDHLIYLIDQNL